VGFLRVLNYFLISALLSLLLPRLILAADGTAPMLQVLSPAQVSDAIEPSWEGEIETPTPEELPEVIREKRGLMSGARDLLIGLKNSTSGEVVDDVARQIAGDGTRYEEVTLDPPSTTEEWEQYKKLKWVKVVTLRSRFILVGIGVLTCVVISHQHDPVWQAIPRGILKTGAAAFMTYRLHKLGGIFFTWLLSGGFLRLDPIKPASLKVADPENQKLGNDEEWASPANSLNKLYVVVTLFNAVFQTVPYIGHSIPESVNLNYEPLLVDSAYGAGQEFMGARYNVQARAANIRSDYGNRFSHEQRPLVLAAVLSVGGTTIQIAIQSGVPYATYASLILSGGLWVAYSKRFGFDQGVKLIRDVVVDEAKLALAALNFVSNVQERALLCAFSIASGTVRLPWALARKIKNRKTKS
jgi:hypothetical protein